MRKTSFGLGLAGGIAAVCLGIHSLLNFGIFRFLDSPFFGKPGGAFPNIIGEGSRIFRGMFKFMDFAFSYFWIGAIVTIAAGIVGIIGACLVKRNNKTAGIMLLIAAALCIIGLVNMELAGLLIPAGILALVKQKPKPMPETQA